MNETALVPQAQRASAMAAMASRFSMDPTVLMNTLKNTVFKGATNEQLAALVVVANEHRLNPFTREIYAFPDKSGGIQAVIGVDGWIRIINQNKAMDGMSFEFTDDSCTCTVHVKGRAHPIQVTEYLDECKRSTDAWNKMPRRMLRHRAMIQAGRLAFGLSDLKDEEDVVVDVRTTVSEPIQISAPEHHPASTTVAAAPADNSNPDPAPQQPAAAPEPPDAEPTRASLLAKFFQDECKADYSQVVKTLVRLGSPKNADSFESFEAMPEKELMKVWSARRGIAGEVRRDLGN